MKRPRPPTRAQPLGYASFFVALIVAGLMWIMFQDPINRVQSKRDNATAEIQNQTRREAMTRGADFLDILLNNYLVIAMVIGFVGLLVFTVFLRRGGPR